MNKCMLLALIKIQKKYLNVCTLIWVSSIAASFLGTRVYYCYNQNSKSFLPFISFLVSIVVSNSIKTFICTIRCKYPQCIFRIKYESKERIHSSNIYTIQRNMSKHTTCNNNNFFHSFVHFLFWFLFHFFFFYIQ